MNRTNVSDWLLYTGIAGIAMGICFCLALFIPSMPVFIDGMIVCAVAVIVFMIAYAFTELRSLHNPYCATLV